MASIGSVFLGDVQRNRLRSSDSTPPSSPPAMPTPGSSAHSPPTTGPAGAFPDPIQEQEISPQPHLAPTQSLELRHDQSLAGLRERQPELKRGETLIRATENAQRRMNDMASSYDVLRRFIGHYEQHAQYLTPAFALSGTLPTITPPEYKDMSPADLAALAAELEPDIRAADNDMREIDDLQRRESPGQGRYYEGLQPRLEALLLRHKEDLDRAAVLERRVAEIVRQYAMQVDNLSELFVAWDETLCAAEDRVGNLEKEKDERSRRGYE
ncbi:hypothetical protein BC826DRAFT_1090138 [Russula brevipes]|nr:hypothetical protein BC826DRAFT_1090138 [Russula brevipes]